MDVAELKKQLQWALDNHWRVDMGTWLEYRDKVQEPDTFKGDEWKCYTVACLAGWTALNHGWRPAVELRRDIGGDYWSTRIGTVSKLGENRTVWDVGAKLLDLDEEEAQTIFHAKTLGRAWEYANRYSAGAIGYPAHLFDDDGYPLVDDYGNLVNQEVESDG